MKANSDPTWISAAMKGCLIQEPINFPHEVVSVSRHNCETKRRRSQAFLNDLGVGSVLRQINLRDRSCALYTSALALSFQKIVGSVSRFPTISRVSILGNIFLPHTNVLPLLPVCCSLLLFFKVFLAVRPLFGPAFDRLFALFWPCLRECSMAIQAALEAVLRGKAPRSVHRPGDWQRVRDSNPCTGLERAVS